MEATIQRRIALLRRELADAAQLERDLNKRAIEVSNTGSKDGSLKISQSSPELLKKALYDPSRGQMVSSEKSVKVANQPTINWIKENRAAYPHEPQVSYLRTQEGKVPSLPRDEDVYQTLSKASKKIIISKPLPRPGPRPRLPKRNRSQLPGDSSNSPGDQAPYLVRKLAETNNAQDRALEASLDALQHSMQVTSSKIQYESGQKSSLTRTKAKLQAPGLVLAPVMDIMLRFLMRLALHRLHAHMRSMQSLETHFLIHLSAVLKLQSRYRGMFARRHARILQEQRLLRRHAAATRIQAVWRRYLARRIFVALQLEALHKTAICIQSCWRGYLARRRAWMILRRRIYAIAQRWMVIGNHEHPVQRPGLLQQEFDAMSQVAQVMLDSKERLPQLSPHVLSGLSQGVQVVLYIRQATSSREVSPQEPRISSLEARIAEREKQAIQAREVAEKQRMQSLEKRERRMKAKQQEEEFLEKSMREERERLLQEERKLRAKQMEAEEKQRISHRVQNEKDRRRALAKRDAQLQRDQEANQRERELVDAIRALQSQCDEDIFALYEDELPEKTRKLKFDVAQKRVCLRKDIKDLEERQKTAQAQIDEPLLSDTIKEKIRGNLAMLVQEMKVLQTQLGHTEEEEERLIKELNDEASHREVAIREQYAKLKVQAKQTLV